MLHTSCVQRNLCGDRVAHNSCSSLQPCKEGERVTGGNTFLHELWSSKHVTSPLTNQTHLALPSRAKSWAALAVGADWPSRQNLCKWADFQNGRQSRSNSSKELEYLIHLQINNLGILHKFRTGL